MSGSEVFPVEEIATSREEWRWPFSEQRRNDIATHFAMLKHKTPALFNGPVLLMNRCVITPKSMRGSFFETRFADFMAWRNWGYPDPDIVNSFSMAAIRTADGAYLLGIMGDSTVNAGQMYFPSGTPDPSDVVGSTVDLAGSVMREVAEETGLEPADFETPTRWTAVRTGPSLALMRELQAHDDAEPLRARVINNLAQQDDPELSGVYIVRDRSDLNAAMPDFMIAFLDHALAR